MTASAQLPAAPRKARSAAPIDETARISVPRSLPMADGEPHPFTRDRRFDPSAEVPCRPRRSSRDWMSTAPSSRGEGLTSGRSAPSVEHVVRSLCRAGPLPHRRLRRPRNAMMSWPPSRRAPPVLPLDSHRRDDGRRIGEPRCESRKGRRTAAALSRGVGRGPVDHEKVDVSGHLRQGRAGVPGRVALQRRVHDMRDVEQRFTPQHVRDERDPSSVVLERHDGGTTTALPQQAAQNDGAYTASAFDDPRSATLHNLIAHTDQPGRAHCPGAPRQIVSPVE